MSDAVKIGSALAGGYLLGRTRKAKTAIGLAMWLSGTGRPSDWLRKGVIGLAQSPEGARLMKQVRGPLLESARGAATSTFNAQLGAWADDLNRRTGVLTGAAEPITPDEDEEEAAEDEPDEEYADDAEDEDEPQPRRTTAGRSTATRSAPARKPTGKKSTAGKSTTKKPMAKGSAGGSTRSRSGSTSAPRKAPPAKKSSGGGSRTSRRQASSRRSAR